MNTQDYKMHVQSRENDNDEATLEEHARVSLHPLYAR